LSTQDISYQSRAYLDYFSIDHSNYTDKISCYESRYKEIQCLHDSARLEIDIDYTISLFEVGRYHQYIDQSEPLIIEVIDKNIIELNGRDIFQYLLFNKAACHYNLNQIPEAVHIIKELCHMDKSNQTYYNFASKVIRIHSYRQFDKIKGAASALIIAGLVVVIFEILLARTLFLDFALPLEYLRNTMLASSILLLVINEWLIRAHIKKTIVK